MRTFRYALLGIALALPAVVLAQRASKPAAQTPQAITVYKTATCGCCTKWVDHLKAAGLDANHLPQTLEELMQWGRKLDRYDEHGALIRMGFMPTEFRLFAPVFGRGKIFG